jgi:3alpha(or 20beta)-hydroxysteroid dehydrogenase
VNNAGLYRPETIPDTTPEDFDLQYKVNQFGTYLGVKFAEAAMGPDGGSIVNISSLAGLRASKGIAYVGTKWAVRGMTKTAARELGPRGIRVNSVHPGIILTPMLDAWSDEDLKTRTAQVPLGRAGMPEDVVHMVLFLLSDFSLYISGGEIAIDGGLSV